MKVTVSAPGKLMLMGEHAVLYGRPCIVTAVDKRITVSIEPSSKTEIITSGDTRFVDQIFENFPVCVEIKGDFTSNYGLGSSSAVTVASVFALHEFLGKKISKKELFDEAYNVVLAVQGKGSGFDVAAAIWGGTLYFVGGGKIIEPLNIQDIPLVVGYTGVKADTVKIIDDVFQKKQKEPEKVGKIFDAIGKLVDDAKIKIRERDFERVGKLMDFNQEYLRDLGVSTQKIEQLISAAKSAGAWGAKLSGAGGGDCMIALGDKNKLAKSIYDAGGTVLDIQTNAEGVRIEL